MKPELNHLEGDLADEAFEAVHFLLQDRKKLFFIDMACATSIAIMDLAFPIITRTFMKDFIPNRNLRAVALWVVFLIEPLSRQVALPVYRRLLGSRGRREWSIICARFVFTLADPRLSVL